MKPAQCVSYSDQMHLEYLRMGKSLNVNLSLMKKKEEGGLKNHPWRDTS
jgi:hypothetical protein